ncbi:MAG: hypothetical protein GEV28_16655 [Actinophytocola sp.]|uniref:hypothetical protein n=1 Tax=Actinophytocola sp. TaxID=1872138 RepID=UPI00132C4D27|nr:hypothetical protein [Actinophytocola sp.]MPZ81927.1 hypothetical protein [Actinophytocola sp.]
MTDDRVVIYEDLEGEPVSRDPVPLRPLWINVAPGKAAESRSYWMYLGFSPTRPRAALAAAA